MTTFLRKHSTPILVLVLLMLLLLAWRFPAGGLKLGVVFLSFSLVTASVAALEAHKTAFRQGRIGRLVFIRNGFLEITGILLAMSLAGGLGRPLAVIATRQIGNDVVRVIAGIAVGLLVGIGIGTIVRQTWGRLAK